MQFPSFADFGDDGVCSFEINRQDDMNVMESWVFKRSISFEAVEAPVVPTMRRVMSEDQLESAASVADTFNNQTRCGSPVSRCDSAGSWLRVSELLVARHLFDEVAGSPRP
ncbi:hypothetical protein T484DRAFT_1758377, partial [Baffinella frigidus]